MRICVSVSAWPAVASLCCRCRQQQHTHSNRSAAQPRSLALGYCASVASPSPTWCNPHNGVLSSVTKTNQPANQPTPGLQHNWRIAQQCHCSATVDAAAAANILVSFHSLILSPLLPVVTCLCSSSPLPSLATLAHHLAFCYCCSSSVSPRVHWSAVFTFCLFFCFCFTTTTTTTTGQTPTCFYHRHFFTSSPPSDATSFLLLLPPLLLNMQHRQSKR